MSGLLALALLAAAEPVSAHPSLEHGQPQTEVVARATPREVVLSFTEPVVAAGSRIELWAPDGRQARVGRPSQRGDHRLAAPVLERLRPAVYDLRWSVAGDDGHEVSGTYRFGVARAGGGAPPGVERLGAPGARGVESAEGDSFAEVVARWLGLVAAGVLLAGALLRLRASGGGDPRWARLSLAALAVLASVSLSAVMAAFGVGDESSPRVLVAQPEGVLALVRLGVVLALAAAALRLRARSAGAADRALLATGATALVTYALAGHVLTATGAPVLAYAVQVAHVLAAGVWMGGLVVLALGAPRDARSLRSFAPVAAGSVAVLAVTGIAAAVREVDEWYFLRWSDYGRVVIAKAVLLLALAPAAVAGAVALRRWRGVGRALRIEAVGALVLVLLASTLAGLAPGRGQPAPAQRGNLLSGVGVGTVAARGVDVRVTLAPAQPGRNLIAATPEPRPGGRRWAEPSSLAVELRCVCAPQPVMAVLRRGRAGTWSTTAALPARGTYITTLLLDGARAGATASLPVGDVSTRGSPPREALMTADLTGRDASRCRGHAAGAVLAIGRLDAGGGLPGGRKVVLRVEDDGGDPRRAAALVRAARDRGAIALVGPCGAGAPGALGASGELPAIASDPAAPPVAGRRVWRTAGDPRAEGAAVARYALERSRSATPRSRRSVAAVVVPASGVPPTGSSERLAGLEAALRPAGVRVERLTARDATSPGALARAVDPRRHLATFLDGDPRRLSAALQRVGARAAGTGRPTSVMIAASPLLDERFQERTGTFGASGAIASPAEVIPGSADGIRYVRQTLALFPGERPSISGLRGYVAGLTLAAGVRDGDEPDRIADRLRRPAPFTGALVAPWRDDAPGAGDPYFVFLSPRLLSASLIAPGGGRPHSGSFFVGGTWSRSSAKVYGPGR